MAKVYVLLEGDANHKKNYYGVFSTPELAKQAALANWPPDGEMVEEFNPHIGEVGALKLEYDYTALFTPAHYEFWIMEQTPDFYVVKG